MNYYIATGFNKQGEAVQLCVEISPADTRFDDPIKCCTNAASANFWRAYFKGKSIAVDRLSSIKPIHGLLSYAPLTENHN